MAAGLLAGARVPQGRALELRQASRDNEERLIVLQPAAARMASLGYNELLADLFWARLLVYYGDRIGNAGDLSDVVDLVALVNTLDPHFRRPFRWGAYATMFRERVGETQRTSSQDDVWASIAILERGIRSFPDDWEMHWVLGLRYFYDLKPGTEMARREAQEKGVFHIERAMRLPNAPASLPISAATMRTKLGQKERAIRDLREMILSTEDPAARVVLEAKYAELMSVQAADELAAVKQTFDARKKATLPYVPDDLFILVGDARAPAWDPAKVAEPEAFEAQP